MASIQAVALLRFDPARIPCGGSRRTAVWVVAAVDCVNHERVAVHVRAAGQSLQIVELLAVEATLRGELPDG